MFTDRCFFRKKSGERGSKYHVWPPR